MLRRALLSVSRTRPTSLRYMSGAAGMSEGNDPIDMIARVPPIEVDANVAVCHGGVDDPSLGHPTEYIQLNRKQKGIETCKYCGLRYVQKPHDH